MWINDEQGKVKVTKDAQTQNPCQENAHGKTYMLGKHISRATQRLMLGARRFAKPN